MYVCICNVQAPCLYVESIGLVSIHAYVYECMYVYLYAIV